MESLKLLYKNKKIVIPKLSGGRIIFEASDVFSSWIDPHFKNWDLNKNGKNTPKTELQVYEVVKNAILKKIFYSLSNNLDDLCLTQDQIIDFCIKYPDFLKQDGYGTFFLFKENNKYFVIGVDVDLEGLYIDIDCFDNIRVYAIGCFGRIVIPKLN